VTSPRAAGHDDRRLAADFTDEQSVDELNRRGIAARALHSMLLPEAKREALDAARRGALRLLTSHRSDYERELVRKILAGIARAGERYGRNRIAAMLLGDTGDLPPALSRLSTTGVLRHETGQALHGWIDACVTASLVVVSKDQYWRLSLTPEGRDVMRGRGAT
jgi:superfamily II DNA helicase RecQ